MGLIYFYRLHYSSIYNQVSKLFSSHSFLTHKLQVLINNNGNTESAANQLIDVNTANTDVQGLIQEETTVLANIK